MSTLTKKKNRWDALIQRLVINPEEITITELAEKIGTSRTTLYNDFNDPEFIAYRNEAVNSLMHRGGLVKAHAINNIINDIVVNKSVSSSKWWMENIERISEQDLEDPIAMDVIDKFKKDEDENLDELDEVSAPAVFAAFRDLRNTLIKQGIDPDSVPDEISEEN